MKKNTYFTINCFVIVLSIQSIFAQIPVNGLIGYFPFNGNANDQYGNGITGTPTSGSFYHNTPPVLVTDRNSINNSAYDFEPAILSTSYIDLGQPGQFNFGYTSSFSISLWMKFVDYQVSATMIANDAWHLGIKNLSGNDHLNFVFGGGDFISDYVMSTNTWVHVAGVFNLVNHTMEMYINGNLASGFPYNNGSFGPSHDSLSTSTWTLNGTPSTTTQIGQLDIYPTTGFKGIIDDVLIYNRALTSLEVTGIYTATSGPSRIIENSYNDNISVFPNPNNGKFQIKYGKSKIIQNLQTEIYNMLGEKVIQFQNNKEIDITNVPKGIYFVKNYDGEKIYSCKMIVQ